MVLMMLVRPLMKLVNVALMKGSVFRGLWRILRTPCHAQLTSCCRNAMCFVTSCGGGGEVKEQDDAARFLFTAIPEQANATSTIISCASDAFPGISVTGMIPGSAFGICYYICDRDSKSNSSNVQPPAR